MTCFMFGHRDAPEGLIPLLKECVEQHISEYGVTEFIVGHYGAFDRMAAGAVREAKRLHPNVSLRVSAKNKPAQMQLCERVHAR